MSNYKTGDIVVGITNGWYDRNDSKCKEYTCVLEVILVKEQEKYLIVKVLSVDTEYGKMKLLNQTFDWKMEYILYKLEHHNLDNIVDYINILGI